MIEIKLNNQKAAFDVDPDMPLLWVLRDFAKLTGTKYGCGVGQCGACTVHVDGAPVRSCLLPISSVAGKSITTIEGLGDGGLHPVQQAWVDNNVPQCGYCQSGQIMSAVALLASNTAPNDEDVTNYMQGNICRCGTYPRIKKAIQDAAVKMHEPKEPSS